MDLKFLPDRIKLALSKVDLNFLYGIRLRKNFPIIIYYKNDRYFLADFGITKDSKKGLFIYKSDVDYIIDKITFHSIYAYNESIKKGFITTEDGIRVGLSGECVFDKEILTIKNFSSLNIRIPHEILYCAKEVFNQVYENGELYSTLIISPPFCGKTTILKDLIREIGEKTDKQILVIDERGEFNSCYNLNTDIIKFSDKLYAFNYGIRSLSPNIVITDEIQSYSDWNCVKSAVNSGVKIIASCHASNISELKNKDFFIDGIFDKYIVLKNGELGIVENVYNKDFNLL